MFRDGECFLHVVSLLHGYAEDDEGEKLVLNVLQTLTSLLTGNDASKVLDSFFFSYLLCRIYCSLQFCVLFNKLILVSKF